MFQEILQVGSGGAKVASGVCSPYVSVPLDFMPDYLVINGSGKTYTKNGAVYIYDAEVSTNSFYRVVGQDDSGPITIDPSLINGILELDNTHFKFSMESPYVHGEITWFAVKR